MAETNVKRPLERDPGDTAARIPVTSIQARDAIPAISPLDSPSGDVHKHRAPEDGEGLDSTRSEVTAIIRAKKCDCGPNCPAKAAGKCCGGKGEEGKK